MWYVISLIFWLYVGHNIYYRFRKDFLKANSTLIKTITTIANSISNIITLTLLVSKKVIAFKIFDLFINNAVAVIINVTNPDTNQIKPHFLLKDSNAFLSLKYYYHPYYIIHYQA